MGCWLCEDREREEPHCQHNDRTDQANLEDGEPPWGCTTLRRNARLVGSCPSRLWIHHRQRTGLLEGDDELRAPSRGFIRQQGIPRQVIVFIRCLQV